MMIDEEKIHILLSKLESASEELLFPSDTEESFESFFWELTDPAPLSSQRVLEYLMLPSQTPVSQKTLDEFFRPVTTPLEWHSDQDLDLVEKFQELTYTIRKNLTKIQVFIVGKEEMDVFIAGKTPEGVWAGLKTKLIDA